MKPLAKRKAEAKALYVAAVDAAVLRDDELLNMLLPRLQAAIQRLRE